MEKYSKDVRLDQTSQTANTNSWHMIRALGGIGILCAFLIVATYQVTLPIIKKNKAEALEKAVFNVLPGTKSKVTFRLNENQFEVFEQEANGEDLYYAGYDENNQLIGIALEASGNGFQDVLGIIYGFSPDKLGVIGMQVLQTKETPGLGDKIEKDPQFLKNFERLEVQLGEDGTSIKNPIETVKRGEKEHPWQIDTITGATISSKAIGNILRASTTQKIPLVIKNVDQFKISTNTTSSEKELEDKGSQQ